MPYTSAVITENQQQQTAEGAEELPAVRYTSTLSVSPQSDGEEKITGITRFQTVLRRRNENETRELTSRRRRTTPNVQFIN